MRERTWLAAIMAVALVAGAGCVIGGGGYARPWFGAPAGSYRETCRYIRVDGYHLKASCERREGSWRSSWLDLRTCDRDVRNDDGYLRCGEWEYEPGRLAYQLPRGSYRKSCTKIHVRNRKIHAECRKIDGRWRHTSSHVNECRRFANQDGRLVCEPGRPQ